MVQFMGGSPVISNCRLPSANCIGVDRVFAALVETVKETVSTTCVLDLIRKE